MRWKRFGTAMTLELIAVSQDRTILNGRLIRCQVSDLLPLLREQDILDPGQGKLATIDPSGNLSAMKKLEKEAPTRVGMVSSAHGR